MCAAGRKHSQARPNAMLSQCSLAKWDSRFGAKRNAGTHNTFQIHADGQGLHTTEEHVSPDQGQPFRDLPTIFGIEEQRRVHVHYGRACTDPSPDQCFDVLVLDADSPYVFRIYPWEDAFGLRHAPNAVDVRVRPPAAIQDSLVKSANRFRTFLGR